MIGHLQTIGARKKLPVGYCVETNGHNFFGHSIFVETAV